MNAHRLLAPVLGFQSLGVALSDWISYFLTPLAIGGAGTLVAALGVEADQVRVLVGPSGGSVDAETVDPAYVAVDLSLSGGSWRGVLWGGPRTSGLSAYWFSRSGSEWTAGPVVSGVDLSPDWVADAAWVPDWVTDRLQEMADTNPPFGSKSLTIRRSFPRDTVAWPTVSVQLDSMAPSAPVIGDLFEAGMLAGAPRAKGRVVSLSVSLVGWALTPEDRSLMGRWLAGAAGLLVDMAKFNGLLEPTWTMEESEDFQTIGVPAFLVTARVSAQARVALSSTVRSGFGRITV